MIEARVQPPQNFAVAVRGLETLDDRVLDAAARGLELGLEYAITIAQREYLSGPRPARLDVVTRRLRNSIEKRVDRTARGVVGRIGTNVVYAAIHEFGGRVHHPARAGSVRLRTNQDGSLLKRRGNLATFARQKRDAHKRFVERTFTSKPYDVDIPARPFIRPAVEQAVPLITRAVEAELAKL